MFTVSAKGKSETNAETVLIRIPCLCRICQRNIKWIPFPEGGEEKRHGKKFAEGEDGNKKKYIETMGGFGRDNLLRFITAIAGWRLLKKKN